MTELPSPIRPKLDEPFSEAESAEIGARIRAKRLALAGGSAQGAGRRQAATWWMAAAAAVAMGVFASRGLQSPEPADPMADNQANQVAGHEASAGVDPDAQGRRETNAPTNGDVIAPGPIRLATGELPSTMAANAGATAQYTFDEGSSIELSAGTSVSTLDNDQRGVAFELTDGEARVRVTPGGPRRWVVQTHLAKVIVVGTEFSVVREKKRVTVRVTRGNVSVESEHLKTGSVLLSEGDEVTVEVTGATQRKTWQRKAEQKKFKEAYRELGRTGIAREAKRARTVNQLFSLSDVARLSGHAQDAVEPLAHLVERFPHDRRAGVAAFTLGRIYMTKLGEPARAAHYFESAIRLDVPPALRESAYVRAIDMRMRARQHADARRLIRAYLSRFTEGHHIDEVREWQAELE